jgi:hypothetical protein
MPYDSFTNSYKYSKTLRANMIGGVNKKLNFGMSFDFIFRASPTATQYNLRFDIKIKLGTNYLRKSTFSSAVTWTTNSADVYSVLFPITTLGGSYQNLTIMFTTPDIPAGVHNANEIVVDLASVTFALGGIVSRFDYGIFRVIDSSTLLYNTSIDNEEESYFEYIAGNTASPINSYDLELEDALVGEPIDPSSYGNLFVYDGSNWVQSTGLWRLEDTGTTFDFNLLRVREILAGQTKATQKYQGGIIGTLDAHSSFEYNGFRFILNGGTYSPTSEKFDAEWYAVSIDRATFAEISGATNQAGSGGDVQLRRSIGGVQTDIGNALYQLNQAINYMSSLSANTTLIPVNQFVEVTAAVTITLPPAADWLSFGKSCEITIKNTAGAGDTVTVTPDGSERIDGAATQSLGQYRSIVLTSNGTDILIKSRL